MPLKQRDMIPLSDPRVALMGHPAPPWLVNYADLMTELVCFFIILYAMSAALNKEIQVAKKAVEAALKQEQVAGEAKVTKDGLQITLQESGENVFFQSGSPDLSPRMMVIMAKMSPTLKRLADDGHDIIVEGHTDDVPIHNDRFTSNWELSTARATRVVQYLIRQRALPAKHMGAIGYGEYHPLIPNDTEEHRAKNRRVVFLVKNKPPDFDKARKAKKAEPSAAEAEALPAESEDGTPPSAEPAALAGEPAVESAVPLPAEAPAENTETVESN